MCWLHISPIYYGLVQVHHVLDDRLFCEKISTDMYSIGPTWFFTVLVFGVHLMRSLYKWPIIQLEDGWVPSSEGNERIVSYVHGVSQWFPILVAQYPTVWHPCCIWKSQTNVHVIARVLWSLSFPDASSRGNCIVATMVLSHFY